MLGQCTAMVCFEHVAVYKKLYERRMRPEFDSALSRHFTESLGAYFELLGSITLARGVPVAAKDSLIAAFDSWIKGTITDMFHDERGHPLLFPTV